MKTGGVLENILNQQVMKIKHTKMNGMQLRHAKTQLKLRGKLRALNDYIRKEGKI